MAKVAVADLANESLDKRVTSFWKTRGNHSRDGLILLDVCIQRAASESRDWDGLARFVSSALKYNQGPIVKKIIRSAFGDKLVWKTNSKHVAGGSFVIGWQGAFNLAGSNTYSVIRSAIEAGEGWDDKEFSTRINKVVLPVVKQRVVSDEAQAKAVKHLSAYVGKLAQDGFNVGAIIAALQKELALKAIPAGKVAKSVVNGIPVYTPDF